MRILSILGQKPEMTGSGVLVRELWKCALKNGDEQWAIVAAYPDDDFNELFDARYSAVTYSLQADAPQGDLPFPILGMSDVMPYPALRYRDASAAQLEMHVWAFQQQMERAIAKFRPDVIHIHHLWLLASLARQTGGIPCFVTVHGTDLKLADALPEHTGRIKESIPYVSAFMCVSNDILEDATRMFDLPRNKVLRIGNGYDERVFHPRGAVVEHSEALVVAAGKYVPWKGFQYLIRACGRLSQPHQLVILGSGPDDLRTQLFAEAKRSNNEERLTLPGHLSQTEVAKWFRGANVFVLPSVYEPFGLVLLEALACGAPAIAGKRGGAKDIVSAELEADGLVTLIEPLKDSGDEDRYVSDLHRALEQHLAAKITAEHRVRISQTVTGLEWTKVYELIRTQYKKALTSSAPARDRLTSYLHGYEHAIFISYASVDNQPLLKGNDGWVDQFHRALEISLSQQFGRRDRGRIWRDVRLGNELLDPAILTACRKSACLLCITSPAYMASEWCLKEFEAFCAANGKDGLPPKHGTYSRIINVAMSAIFTEPAKKIFEERFGKTKIHKFYDSDPGEEWSIPIWLKPQTDSDERYHQRIGRLARDIHALLESMNASAQQRSGEPIREPQPGPNHPYSLEELLSKASDQIIVSGNTIDRFSNDDKVRVALIRALLNGVKLTLIIHNPESASARAHAPFYPRESSGEAESHQKRALKFVESLFEVIPDDLKPRFEVLLSNYTPRFRAIALDQSEVYLYLYMYGEDVSEYPDFALRKNVAAEADQAKKHLQSLNNLIRSPEIIPYIRDVRRCDYWRLSKLAQWDSWSPEVRYRHRITHEYYVTHAKEFHKMFGHAPEPYVQKHLDVLRGRTIVLGCGSGKEVEHLFRQGRCTELTGIDFSPEAIRLARIKNQDSTARFIIADFYDLEYIEPGQYDSIAANAAFVHLFERSDMSQLLASVWKKLRPGGKCFIRGLYREKDGVALDQEYHASADRLKDARWFVYYSREYLVKLATDQGFGVDDETTAAIAEKCGFKDRDVVLNKGFVHAEFDYVYWPTLLLVKPDDPPLAD